MERATQCVLTVISLACAIPSFAQEDPKATLKTALDASDICPGLPQLDACEMAESVGADVGNVCDLAPEEATRIAFDKNAHEVTSFEITDGGGLSSNMELGCQTSSEAVIPNLRIPEDVACTAQVTDQCTAENVSCNPSGEVGKLFAHFGDLNAKMKSPLEQAAAVTEQCQ